MKPSINQVTQTYGRVLVKELKNLIVSQKKLLFLATRCRELQILLKISTTTLYQHASFNYCKCRQKRGNLEFPEDDIQLINLLCIFEDFESEDLEPNLKNILKHNAIPWI